MLTIAIGADHRGFLYKTLIKNEVKHPSKTIEWIDVGCFSEERTDYPLFAFEVVRAMQSKRAEYGILICGTAVGMAIAANRFDHMFAAVVWSIETATRAKEEDNANILSLPADYIAPVDATMIVTAWLNAQFLDDRYQARIDMINNLGACR